MTDLIAELRARAEASGGDKLLEEAAAALEAAREDAERLEEALRYARRFLRPEDHDTAYVDAAIDQARGKGGCGEGVKNANG